MLASCLIRSISEEGHKPEVESLPPVTSQVQPQAPAELDTDAENDREEYDDDDDDDDDDEVIYVVQVTANMPLLTFTLSTNICLQSKVSL